MRAPILERLFGPLCLAAVAVSCGGSAPSSPTGPLVLAAGDDTLAIATGGGSPILCMSTGPDPPAGHAVVNVHVKGADGGWFVQADAGTLTMRLAPSGRGVIGAAHATALGIGGVSVSLGWPDGLEARVSGEPAGERTLRGTIDGNVDFAASGGPFGCFENVWVLGPR